VRLAAGEPAPGDAFDWQRAAEHCRSAYLRGVLLAHGSLSLAGGRLHLEVVLPEADARALHARVSAAGLRSSVRVRRGRGVVTWKGADAIVMLLRRTGASVSALELETRLVTRALRGQLNRAFNAEGANVHRSVATAARQLAAIELLDAHGRLEDLPPSTRTLAELRREAPDATFSELALRLGVTRSLVQRAFARIEALAAALSPGSDGVRD
jgi:hypothetical protein